MSALSPSPELFCIVVLAVMLLIVAAIDFRHFVISNRSVSAIALLYPVYAFSAGLDASTAGWLGGLAAGAIVLALAAGLFALNVFGGGDAKLIAAIALWAGPSLLAHFLLITAITGGVLAAAFLVAKSVAKPAVEPATLEDGNEDNIPYGIAISTGGLFVCWQLLAG